MAAVAEPTVTRWTRERALRTSGLSQRARLAALILATYMDARRGDTRDAHGRDHAPGMLTLAVGMGYSSRDSAQAAVGELVDGGWLVVLAGGGRQRPNRYLARTLETADEGPAVSTAEKLPTHPAGAGSIASDTGESRVGSIDEKLPTLEPAPSDREEETTSSTGPSEQEAEALAVLAAGVPAEDRGIVRARHDQLVGVLRRVCQAAADQLADDGDSTRAPPGPVAAAHALLARGWEGCDSPADALMGPRRYADAVGTLVEREQEKTRRALEQHTQERAPEAERQAADDESARIARVDAEITALDDHAYEALLDAVMRRDLLLPAAVRALFDRQAPWAEIRQRTMAAALVRTAYREVMAHHDEGDEELSASSERARAAVCRDFPATGRGQQRDHRHDRHRAAQRDQQRDGQCDRQRDRGADPQALGVDPQGEPA